MSCKQHYNPVPSTPRAGRSLLRHDSALWARNSHVTWPWSIGLGKNLFPVDGHWVGVSCAGLRKTSAGSPPRTQHQQQRRRRKQRDLQDLLARRAVMSKEDYRRRIQGILRGRRAQQVAASCTKSFRKACTLVLKNSGGAGK